MAGTDVVLRAVLSKDPTQADTSDAAGRSPLAVAVAQWTGGGNDDQFPGAVPLTRRVRLLLQHRARPAAAGSLGSVLHGTPPI